MRDYRMQVGAQALNVAHAATNLDELAYDLVRRKAFIGRLVGIEEHGTLEVLVPIQRISWISAVA